MYVCWASYITNTRTFPCTARAVHLIINLVKKRQTGAIKTYIVSFKDALRRLKENGVELDTQITVAFFLVSLSPRFAQFVTQMLMEGNINVDKMYERAVKYEQTNLMRSGEANGKRNPKHHQECHGQIFRGF